MPASPDQARSPTAAEAWSTELNIVGQPRVKDGAALAFVAEDRELFLMAFDAADGKVRWRYPVTPGLEPAGNAPLFALADYGDGKTAVVVPTPDDFRYPGFRPEAWPFIDAISVFDLDTGERLRNSAGMLVDDAPQECAGEDAGVCFAGIDRENGPRFQRLDPASLKIAPNPRWASAGAEVRPVNEGNLFLYFSPKETSYGFGEMGRDKPLWKLEARDVLGPAATRGSLYGAAYYEEQDLYLVRLNLESGSPKNKPIDLSRNGLAGIEAGTGKVLWRAPASDCNHQIDAGPHERDGAPPMAVRCLPSGTMTIGKDGKRSFRDLDVRIQGYEPGTGKVLWEFDAGAAEGLVAGDDLPGFTRGTDQQIDANGENLVIDLLTGQTSPSGESQATPAGLCLAESTYEYWRAVELGGPAPSERTGGRLARPCRPAGQTGPTEADVENVGARDGDMVLVAYAGRLVGYSIPKSAPSSGPPAEAAAATDGGG
jgi:outer membrane protein assembly factor BamB